MCCSLSGTRFHWDCPYPSNVTFLNLCQSPSTRRERIITVLWVLVQCPLYPITYGLERETYQQPQMVAEGVVDLKRRRSNPVDRMPHLNVRVGSMRSPSACNVDGVSQSEPVPPLRSNKDKATARAALQDKGNRPHAWLRPSSVEAHRGLWSLLVAQKSSHHLPDTSHPGTTNLALPNSAPPTKQPHQRLRNGVPVALEDGRHSCVNRELGSAK